MAQSSFLGDMLTTLFERRRSANTTNDPRSIKEMCIALLAAEGEVSGTRLAKAILSRYEALDASDKLAFFHFLNDDLELDAAQLRELAEAYTQSPTVANYRAIATAGEPRRQELLRRLNQSPGATAALVSMRVDLLGFVAQEPDLKRTDLDFVHLLRSWFNRGFLVLRQISWETPASILEKIVAYEAVHAINDWDDLRRRLYPSDRRCFAYFHPTMPDEPLIFVEVALMKSVPASIQYVLAESRETRQAAETKVAVFYSISNCQDGLQGISFGNLLIKQVVDELSQELPQLDTFVTLSPIPRMNSWLQEQDDPVSDRVVEGQADADEVEAAAAHYLLNAKRSSGHPVDPVARFHLGNGASIHAVHAGGDLTDKGRAQSSGAMVNYMYDLSMIEKNHEKFLLGQDISASKAVQNKAAAYGPLTKAVSA